MTDCVFCDVEKTKPRTIASLDGVNIVATLGQITEGGYILLIPTNHVSCLGAMSVKQISLVDRISEQIKSILNKEYESAGLTIFEHGIVGQTIKHAHLHFFPKFVLLTNKIRSDFPSSEIHFVANLVDLQRLYQKRQEPYLLWSGAAGYNVCWNPPAPPQYLRTISAEKLNVPERADWKKMDSELDKFLIDGTIKKIAPHFN